MADEKNIFSSLNNSKQGVFRSYIKGSEPVNIYDTLEKVHESFFNSSNYFTNIYNTKENAQYLTEFFRDYKKIMTLNHNSNDYKTMLAQSMLKDIANKLPKISFLATSYQNQSTRGTDFEANIANLFEVATRKIVLTGKDTASVQLFIGTSDTKITDIDKYLETIIQGEIKEAVTQVVNNLETNFRSIQNNDGAYSNYILIKDTGKMGKIDIQKGGKMKSVFYKKLETESTGKLEKVITILENSTLSLKFYNKNTPDLGDTDHYKVVAAILENARRKNEISNEQAITTALHYFHHPEFELKNYNEDTIEQQKLAKDMYVHYNNHFRRIYELTGLGLVDSKTFEEIQSIDFLLVNNYKDDITVYSTKDLIQTAKINIKNKKMNYRYRLFRDMVEENIKS